MDKHPMLWSKLDDTFQQDLPLTTELLELLNRERKAIEDRSYDTFQKIIGPKKDILRQLELHASLRQQLLAEAGFTSEANTLAAADVEAPIVASAWRKLSQEWVHCQELNEINERIAKRTRLVVGQILDLIRGQHSQTKLYTAKGDALSSTSGRTITSA